MSKDIHVLLTKFNIVPNEESVERYIMAFTHSSFNNDGGTSHHDYERLEFIGDSIIGFTIADLAFTIHPSMKQGELSKLRANIVQGPSLAQKASEFGFGDYIRAGKSIKYDLKNSKKLMEDVFEAFVGAVYFDQGILFAYKLVADIFTETVRDFKMTDLNDHKTRLQEIIASRNKVGTKGGLDYRLVKEEGPAHQRCFTIDLLFDDICFGTGTGNTKKEAEQNAAKMALEKLVK